jgi:endo-alpha-1,4-polygalactosaminidase (GH114 family)
MDSMDSHVDYMAYLEMYENDLTGSSADNVKIIVKLIAQLTRLKNQQNKMIHPNHAKKWTHEHNKQLLELYKAGSTMEVMVTTLKRTLRSVDYQLSKLLLTHVKASSLGGTAVLFNKTAKQIQSKIDTLHKEKHV